MNVQPVGVLRRHWGAVGAILAPAMQALTSLTLSLVAVRALGAEGLGTFALLQTSIVVATAISTGLVGDSLTVLDRSRASVRGGLEIVAAGVIAATAVLGFTLLRLSDLVTVGEGVLFVLALGAFLVEDLIRRALMANLRFWSVVAVDTSTLLTSACWLIIRYLSGSELSLSDLLVALLLAQLVGMGVGIALLPASERWLASARNADVRSVLRYGSWRAAQATIRPAALSLVRIVVVAALGLAAFGELEAARLYTAPAVLIVQGMASFLFATFASQKEAPLQAKVRRADIAVTFVAALAGSVGTLAVLTAPLFGYLITGGSFELDQKAVLSWAVYAAAAAAVTPYASLAAVSGHHVRLLIVRLSEAVVAIGLVWVMLVGLGEPAYWAPLALAAGGAASALLIRSMLRSAASRDQSSGTSRDRQHA